MSAVPAPLALGVWHELIVHVRWATDSSGTIEVWHRLQGGGTGQDRLPGVATRPSSGPPRRGPSNCRGAGPRTRSALPWPGRLPAHRRQDGFVRTTSFASAVAALS